MKKKLTAILFTAALIATAAIPIAAAGCTPRENVLKVYNVSEYIGEDVVDAFEAYYEEVTGEKIKVKYDTFDENEAMYSRISLNKVDYDVVCPSDYMAEKMLNNGLLHAMEDLGSDVNGQPIEDYRGNVSPMLRTGGGYFQFDTDNKYTTPYMWGTMGILYAEDAVPMSALEEQGWGILWNESYKNRIFMKNSMRDTFVAGALYSLRNPASPDYDPQIGVAEALNSPAYNEVVQKSLIEQKKIIIGYENDEGKSKIIENSADMVLQWSGDAIYAMDGLQEELGLSRDVNYYVPEEGSNLFCDVWVIPKYARNTRAANLWMNFMCRPDIAIANMEEIGYTSAVATEETLEWSKECIGAPSDRNIIETDLTYFFTTDRFGDAAKTLRVFDVQYPDKRIVERCAVMRDYGKNEPAMDDMWTAIKNA